MADFRGINGKSFTVASLKMMIGGDTLKLRSVTPGGREVAQEHIFEVGKQVPVGLVTGAVKPREIATVVDPVSYAAWNKSKDDLANTRVTITAVLMEKGMNSITLTYEECGVLGDEFPELKAGEATEFNATVKWMPTNMLVDDKNLARAS
jgi:hypothetical protein